MWRVIAGATLIAHGIIHLMCFLAR